jgi:hypothetical protein
MAEVPVETPLRIPNIRGKLVDDLRGFALTPKSVDDFCKVVILTRCCIAVECPEAFGTTAKALELVDDGL